jgi:energy-coupling factor transporter ATP-binding protein EcfA2
VTLKTIAIENIKGIKKKCFNLDILPNKPSILVAPNGFGKSSLASAFNSLQTDRLVIDGYSLHEYDNKNRPKLFIKYEKPDNTIIDLEANDLVNTITDHFDYFVISSQVDAKGTGVNYGSEMTINPVILVDEVPEKVKFNYSFKTQKQRFGLNSKVLPNITSLLENLILIRRINEEISILENALKNQIQQKINEFINELNRQIGTSQDLIKWIEVNKVEYLGKVDYLSDLAQIIQQFNCFSSNAEIFLASIQVVNLYGDNKSDFKNACRYKAYEFEKQNYKEILKSFNASWKEVTLKESRRKLIVEFPEFHSISNGERDTLSFVALLEKARRSLIKNSNILVIDEVFDYLDDANLIAVQYYIMEMIEEYRLMGRRIYPLILTHLDPNYFRNFTFSKQKVYYLYDWKLKVNQSLIDLSG